MRLTTKGRFAVIAALDLSLREDESSNAVTLSSISQRQEISLSYLEQLFSRLRRRGIVRSSRGPGGGYRLARSAADISIADVVRAVDEHIDATLCEGMRNCQSKKTCMTHDLWEDLNKHIYSFLTSVTLGSLREQVRYKEAGHMSKATAQKPRQQLSQDSFLSNLSTIAVNAGRKKIAQQVIAAPEINKLGTGKRTSGKPTYSTMPTRRYYGGGSDLPR